LKNDSTTENPKEYPFGFFSIRDMELTEIQEDVFGSIGMAYLDDPSPESGRTYFEGEEEYDAALELKKLGLVRVVEKGKHGKSKYAHFGLTDAGLDTNPELN
jgi:hypothetical protein